MDYLYIICIKIIFAFSFIAIIQLKACYGKDGFSWQI